MNYLEFAKNEETQLVEAIQFRDDALKPFFTKMEEADDVECLKLIHSLYIEVIDHINEESGNFRMVQLNGAYYEMHFHMFTTYLVRLFYESQYWEILLNALDFFMHCGDFDRRSGILDVEDWFKMTFFNILRKLTEEPIENFVKEVQIVCPGYTLNGFDERSINI